MGRNAKLTTYSLALLAVVGILLWWHGPTDQARMAARVVSPPALNVGTSAVPSYSSGGRRIAGTVTLEGAPVPGAHVALHGFLSGVDKASYTEVRADREGRFDFGPQPKAVYDIGATSPTAAAVVLRINTADSTLIPPVDHLELRLRRCIASLSGVVSDATGDPIIKARVALGGVAAVETDTHGKYRICVPLGTSEFNYSADSYASVILTITAMGHAHQDVVLVPEAAIEGRAVAEDGKPVAGALLSAFVVPWAENRAAPSTAISDSEGRFHFLSLLPGRYRVTGRANGAEAEGVEALAKVVSSDQIVVRFSSTARILGRVVRDGKPVAAVHVAAERAGRARRSRVAETQADGTFVLDAVPTGVITFSATPYNVVSPRGFTVDHAKDYTGVTIEVAPLGTIRGRVTRQGVPVENAEVCCARTIDAKEGSATTDTNGNYKIEGVLPGTHDLGAQSLEAGAYAASLPVTVTGSSDVRADIELDLAASIAGSVVDQDGKPVAGVVVRWSNESSMDLGEAVTDEAGKYRCSAMAGGGIYRALVFRETALAPYVSADKAGFPRVVLKDATTHLENQQIAIDRKELSLSGNVVDSSGAAVSDALVRALPTPAGGTGLFQSWMKLPTTFTDGEGHFALHGLVTGTYSVSARAPDGSTGTTANVAAGDTSTIVSVIRPGAIHGVLKGFLTVPTVIASVVGGARANLNANPVDVGSFQFNQLNAGTYIVTAGDASEGDAAIVTVKDGVVTPLTLRSHGRGTVEAVVTNFQTHAPIPGAACHGVPSVNGQLGFTNWNPQMAPLTDAGGRIVLDSTPAGTISIVCAMPSNRMSPPVVDLTLARGGHASVKLLSVELPGLPTSSIGADFDWRVSQPRISWVDENGPARAAGLAVGDLVVAVDGVAVDGLDGAGVTYLIEGHAAGSKVTLTVVRGATRIDIAVAPVAASSTN